MRCFLADAGGVLLGLLFAGMMWAAVLGLQLVRHEPGLWSLRAARFVTCGLDYNGPPFTTSGGVTLWLTCGSEDQGWQLWPR